MSDNDRLDLPPFAALRAFEMAGRLDSFTYAAEALLISQSAVSRQVSALEDLLGCKLFIRDRAGVRLTEAGRSYHQRISRSLREISSATSDFKLQLAGLNLIRLSTLPTLAAHWLLPKLAAFRSEHPHIAVDISSTNELVDLTSLEVDVAIRLGKGDWLDLRADKLFDERLTTVCSPSFVAKAGNFSAADIADLELIHTTTRPDAWQNWSDGNNLRQRIPERGRITCQDFFISIQAAVLNLHSSGGPKSRSRRCAFISFATGAFRRPAYRPVSDAR